jgi:PmbA protein
MILNEFKEKLFMKAKEASFSEYEIYYEEGESLEIQAFKKEIDKYSFNKKLGISFRGLYNGKMGYAYTEIMDEEAIELLIDKAIDNAKTIENNEVQIIFGGSKHYEEFNGYNEELENIDANEKIKLALELEAEAYKCSTKVINTDYCLIGSELTMKRIINSKGLNLSHRGNCVFGVIESVVEEAGKVNNALAYKFSNSMKDIEIKELARESVTEALAYFSAETVKTGKYKVMLKNSVAIDLLQTFNGIFSADNTQKGLSLLKGKVGEKIASEKLTLIDNPLMMESVSSSPFDAEGVATYEKNIIKNGVLNTLLHNIKTATIEGIESTGNASKSSYAAPVEVAPSNFYIKPGEISYEEMIKTLENGLIITEMMGMHSGANPVSGDFSLAAKGFLVQNGVIVRAVEQITVAGNYFELLKNVEFIGGDFKLGMPEGSSCFGSPSIIIKELSIAGE